MQLWFARDTEVPLRQQPVTQVILSIVCDELRPGQRLPSTRELARRFHIHPNTISSAYRQLQRERWLEVRRGSGVYVRTSKPKDPLSPELAVDRLIRQLFLSAGQLGIEHPIVRHRVKYWLEAEPPDHVLLIEPDMELRRILMSEMSSALKLPVVGGGLTALTPPRLKRSIVVSLSRCADEVREKLPAGVELVPLQLNSVTAALIKWLPAPKNVLLGVASRWPQFLKSASTMLIAAGFERDAVFFRDARKSGWRTGLDQAAAVVCDSVTAAQLPKKFRIISFPLLSDSSRDELRRRQEAIGHPFAREL
jgi:DNA-binding transcriptional regulator YhcF (GntR family)